MENKQILAECHADAGGNSYVYYFTKESTNPGMGACHAMEDLVKWGHIQNNY